MGTAKKTDAVVENDEMTLLTSAPDEWEFETVSDESPARIVFEKVGETFVGQYVGMEHIQPENGEDPFDLYVFRGRDGNLYSLNNSFKIEKGMQDVKPDAWVRVTYVKEIPVKKGNPMKDFKVEVRKN